MDKHERWMEVAIEAAREGIAKGQSPFGCAIVRGNDLVAASHNEVVLTNDPTAHAEVVALRRAGRALSQFELPDCRLYSTCEPCPMCASAIHWAKIPELYYGAGIEDAAAAGFCEIHVHPEDLYRHTSPPVAVFEGVRREDCRALFEVWKSRTDRIVY